MTNLSQLQLHLDTIIKFIKPHLPFVNCHMVNYLTDDLWGTFIPSEIKDEITNKEDIAAAIDLFWQCNKGSELKEDRNKYTNFINFVHSTQKYHLDQLKNVSVNLEELNDVLSKMGCNTSGDSIHVKEFMSAKKNHEVETTTQLVATLCSRGNLSVIDAGDGKGYLSSRLALEHELLVLGVDASSINTKGAVKRIQKLEKAWTSLTKRAEDVKNGITPPRIGRRRRRNAPLPIESASPASELYRTTTHFITTETDFVKLFQQHFPNQNNPNGFCLTGLHTCGNLSPSCLTIFKENKDFSTLCNIGCCYHLLVEEFKKDEFFSSNSNVAQPDDDPGFPMSQYLRDQKFSLGRNSRMLACQSLSRTVDAAELPISSLFYRSLLEVLIVQENSELKNCVQVGRIKKCPGNFVEYVEKCRQRCKLELGAVTTEKLLDLHAQYEYQQLQLNLFYLIRQTFAPILEAIILLDRLLYLRENAINHSYIVKLFDAVISPRCYGIVAIKN